MSFIMYTATWKDVLIHSAMLLWCPLSQLDASFEVHFHLMPPVLLEMKSCSWLCYRPGFLPCEMRFLHKIVIRSYKAI